MAGVVAVLPAIAVVAVVAVGAVVAVVAVVVVVAVLHSFFFYKNLFYKNVEAEIDPNFKNVLRTFLRLRVD